MKAKMIHLGRQSDGYLYFNAKDEEGNWVDVELNIDQVALLLKLSAEIVSRCSIVMGSWT